MNTKNKFDGHVGSGSILLGRLNTVHIFLQVHHVNRTKIVKFLNIFNRKRGSVSLQDNIGCGIDKWIKMDEQVVGVGMFMVNSKIW